MGNADGVDGGGPEHTASSSDAEPKPSRVKKVEEFWDAKTFGKKCRPLQMQSIWHMPTSRFPDPVIEPVQIAKTPTPVSRSDGGPAPSTSSAVIEKTGQAGRFGIGRCLPRSTR